eukprot:TRINITY_DN4637_c0_g1_i1.p1 TRINITY_DN4637_c0_g1~~TRINITY_DN4637_c0_g1_i1.p1  ORF type:complete len:170 (+),score=16.56 TRINITY_DN4637_c0_g1_i1:36-512(+)
MGDLGFAKEYTSGPSPILIMPLNPSGGLAGPINAVGGRSIRKVRSEPANIGSDKLSSNLPPISKSMSEKREPCTILKRQPFTTTRHVKVQLIDTHSSPLASLAQPSEPPTADSGSSSSVQTMSKTKSAGALEVISSQPKQRGLTKKRKSTELDVDRSY